MHGNNNLHAGLARHALAKFAVGLAPLYIVHLVNQGPLSLGGPGTKPSGYIVAPPLILHLKNTVSI